MGIRNDNFICLIKSYQLIKDMVEDMPHGLRKKVLAYEFNSLAGIKCYIVLCKITSFYKAGPGCPCRFQKNILVVAQRTCFSVNTFRKIGHGEIVSFSEKHHLE